MVFYDFPALHWIHLRTTNPIESTFATVRLRTTKTKGSGIGLSMVYRTVQMHDGEIEVQSIPGTGSTFTILLPQA